MPIRANYCSCDPEKDLEFQDVLNIDLNLWFTPYTLTTRELWFCNKCENYITMRKTYNLQLIDCDTLKVCKD